MTQNIDRYDTTKSYRWNYDHAPDWDASQPASEPVLADRSWTFCGIPVPSPLGMPAGPLLNGKWILHYARLGFDVLTYKTVRSRFRECYPLPNLQPIAQPMVVSGQVAAASQSMDKSWAISFGMPSMQPDVWRQDIEWTRQRLAPHKVLSVSVVASAEPDWTLEQVASDYAQCAEWAKESGADCVELNFSCPNVSSVDGQLYQAPEASCLVLETVRDRIGPDTPLLIKVGVVTAPGAALALLQACHGRANAVSMTNCLPCQVALNDQLLFQGQPRGIGGLAIRDASISQVAMFSRTIGQHELDLSIIGVGGIYDSSDVQAYLDAGAESVQIATAAMLDPGVGLRIKHELSRAAQLPT